MQLRRREFLASSLAALAGPAADPPLPKPPSRLLGYGVVNLWHTIDAARLADVLSRARCTFTEIEYVPWFNKKARDGESIETHVELAKQFVAELRKRELWTLISVVNWNGAAQRKQPDSWFRDRVQEIRHEIGPERVLLLGVSEPDGQEHGKAKRWSELAMRDWPGVKVGNGDGGRGAPTVGGFNYVDWHHCADFDEKSLRIDTAGKPTINNTDCGPVLNPGPKRAKQMAKVALARNAHFLVYGWKDERIDEDVVAALGDEAAHQTSSARRDRIAPSPDYW